MSLDAGLVTRLHARAGAARWKVTVAAFGAALERSVARGLPAGETASAAVGRYLESLHLTDLALACACATGDEAAWEHFVREYRPALYRAADAIDASGNGRELADSLYGDLFGLKESAGERQSLFRYFHGRSSMATWLRSVMAQRHVDRVRATSRLAPLDEDDGHQPVVAPPDVSVPQRTRLAAMAHAALAAVLGALPTRDRLRLTYYYAQQLTLAQVGRLTGEHEASVSRNLARVRREIRGGVERHLRDAHGLSDAAIDECFAAVAGDPGTFDLATLFAGAGGEGCKIPEPARSQTEELT